MAKPAALTQAQAAALIDKTDRRLRQLEDEKLPPPKNDAGQYDPRDYGRWMLQRWRDSLRLGEDGEEIDYGLERAKLTRAQRLKCELEIDRLNNEGMEEVAEEWRRAAVSVQQRLMSLPSRLRQILTLDDAGESLVREEVTTMLRALGDDPEG